MKRLILDYYRRWWGVLALCSVFAFLLGWSIAQRPEGAFEFWVLLLTMWTGACLLSFDVKRGVVRAITILPLTRRQIGRGWWLATVAIPAIALTVLLFLGAGTFALFHPKAGLPADRLIMASLFTLPWLGTMFVLCFPAPGLLGKGWELAIACLVNVISMAMLFGSMLICQGASKNPYKCAFIFGLGALLIAVGWLRSGQLGLSRNRFPIAAHQRKALRGQHRVPDGHGGMAFLIRTTLIRTFLMGLGMVALMILVLGVQGHMDRDVIEFQIRVLPIMLFAGILLQLLSSVRHLRFLRTLPISSTSLAAVIIAMAILPFFALGALAAGVAGLTLQNSTALMVLKQCTFALAPASLCVFFAVWQGESKQGYALMGCTIVGSLIGNPLLRSLIQNRETPMGMTAVIAAACVFLAFLLTRIALKHSSQTYRVHATVARNTPWSMGR